MLNNTTDKGIPDVLVSSFLSAIVQLEYGMCFKVMAEEGIDEDDGDQLPEGLEIELGEEAREEDESAEMQPRSAAALEKMKQIASPAPSEQEQADIKSKAQ